VPSPPLLERKELTLNKPGCDDGLPLAAQTQPVLRPTLYKGNGNCRFSLSKTYLIKTAGAGDAVQVAIVMGYQHGVRTIKRCTMKGSTSSVGRWSRSSRSRTDRERTFPARRPTWRPPSLNTWSLADADSDARRPSRLFRQKGFTARSSTSWERARRTTFIAVNDAGYTRCALRVDGDYDVAGSSTVIDQAKATGKHCQTCSRYYFSYGYVKTA